MKKFLVAGAGHGGLCAALHLARAGEQVTVVEIQAREDLGYDWTDAVERSVLVRNGFSPLSDEFCHTYHGAVMHGPSKRWFNLPKDETVPQQMHAERKEILKIMVDDCLKAGVEILFEKEIHSAVVKDGWVKGLSIKGKDGTNSELLADMVIDAAGWNSPVRMGLPKDFAVPQELDRTQKFHVWRAFMERLSGDDPKYTSKYYLGHRGGKALSWVIANKDSMDVLVGNIGQELTDSDIADALRDLREDNPLVGRKILRGGQQVTIPLRRPLGLIVANAYAAVGDSACMTDPLGGSGVGSAMDQGKVLANVLLTHCKGNYSVEKLWKYQYHTFTERPAADIGYATATAEERAATDVLKSMILSLEAQEIDLLFKRGIIAMGGVKGPKDALKVLFGNLDHLPLVFRLAKMGGRIKKIKELVRSIPKEYDRDTVTRWVEAYEGFEMVS